MWGLNGISKLILKYFLEKKYVKMNKLQSLQAIVV
jgi:hypothetical protein